MLKKMLASIGIGAAAIDLEILTPQVEPGQTLKGTVKISGGTIEQEVQKIEISLLLKSTYYDNMQSRILNKVVSSVIIAEKTVIKPGYEKIMPVSFEIPFAKNMPISRGRTRYFLQTNAYIRNAVDPVDHDDILVVPNKYFKMLFDALAHLGFHEKNNSGDFDGFLQEFYYTPTTFFAQDIKEIKVSAKVKKSEMNITIKLDKIHHSLIDSLADDIDPNETIIRFTLIFDEMENSQITADYLKKLFEKECRKIT
ncbi:sporulation protein [Phosphitispora sp. TUW77]|uniref:sporulation protein n=1 Tax=Phosphitispora sp. TUW77 TaxID=3152361 RepID=UPI003AB45DFA